LHIIFDTKGIQWVDTNASEAGSPLQAHSFNNCERVGRLLPYTLDDKVTTRDD